MTEASVTQSLMDALKAALPGAVILKICDRFTKGIPDIDITWRGRNYRLEVKLLKRGNTLEDCSDGLQRLTLTRLYVQTDQRAWYVVYDMRAWQKAVTVYRPQVMTVTEDQAYEFAELEATGFDHQAVADFVRSR